MPDYCPECGCFRSGGVCSNCQEELYILREQSEYISDPVSDAFAEQAEEQARELKRKKGDR
jgi:hypothetical protein